jgi:hypothetical protein
MTARLYWIPLEHASTARWVTWAAGFRITGVPGSPYDALGVAPGEVRVATAQAWRLTGGETARWYRESGHEGTVLFASVDPLPAFVDRWAATEPLPPRPPAAASARTPASAARPGRRESPSRRVPLSPVP